LGESTSSYLQEKLDLWAADRVDPSKQEETLSVEHRLEQTGRKSAGRKGWLTVLNAWTIRGEQNPMD
jgi:hypothetical protein